MFLAASDETPQAFTGTASRYYDNRSVVSMPAELRERDGGSAPAPGSIVKMELSYVFSNLELERILL